MQAEPKYAPLLRDARLELRLWMVEHGVTVKQLAGDMGVDVMTVSRWRTPRSTRPSRKQAEALQRITGGRVTVAMWDACPALSA